MCSPENFFFFFLNMLHQDCGCGLISTVVDNGPQLSSHFDFKSDCCTKTFHHPFFKPYCTLDDFPVNKDHRNTYTCTIKGSILWIKLHISTFILAVCLQATVRRSDSWRKRSAVWPKTSTTCRPPLTALTRSCTWMFSIHHRHVLFHGVHSPAHQNPVYLEETQIC